MVARHKSPLGLLQHLLDPEVDLAGLGPHFLGQVGKGLLARQMPPHNRCFLFRSEMPSLGYSRVSGQVSLAGHAEIPIP